MHVVAGYIFWRKCDPLKQNNMETIPFAIQAIIVCQLIDARYAKKNLYVFVVYFWLPLVKGTCVFCFVVLYVNFTIIVTFLATFDFITIFLPFLKLDSLHLGASERS